jgi:hypothetical protein
MCLEIKSNRKENTKDLDKWFGNRTKFAYVYKVLEKRTEELFYRSLFFGWFIWVFDKQKVFQVKRSSKPTKIELYWGEISDGLHVFTSLETAKKDFYYTHRKDARIVKFRVRRKDVVAVENGYTKDKHNFNEAVCTRLEFVKVIS